MRKTITYYKKDLFSILSIFKHQKIEKILLALNDIEYLFLQFEVIYKKVLVSTAFEEKMNFCALLYGKISAQLFFVGNFALTITESAMRLSISRDF